MKKLVLIFCFWLSFNGITNAQTQTQDTSTATIQETLDWINSKLDEYKNNAELMSVAVDQSCNLIIKIRAQLGSDDVNYCITIPLNTVYSIAQEQGLVLIKFSTKSQSIHYVKEVKGDDEYEKLDRGLCNIDEYRSEYIFGTDRDNREVQNYFYATFSDFGWKIVPSMANAFNHLLKLCSKPTVKDRF